MEYRELDVYLTLRGFLYRLYRMAFAHYPNITREHRISLLASFLTRAHNRNESWNTLQTHDDILNHLNADIICFQGKEMRFADFAPFTNKRFQRSNHPGRLYQNLLLCHPHMIPSFHFRYEKQAILE